MTATKNHDYSYSGVPDKCLLCGDTKASHEPPKPPSVDDTTKLESRLANNSTSKFSEWIKYEAGPTSAVAKMLKADRDLTRVRLMYADGSLVEYKLDGAL